MDSPRILIVEDEKIIGLDLRKRLERLEFSVVDVVSTGEEALRAAAEHRPDIILMDIMLEGDMDGIEAAKAVKQSLGIPVIFLTAFSDEKTLLRAQKAEPLGFLLKPFKERELYSTLSIALYKNTIDRELSEQKKWLSAIIMGVGDGIIATDKNNVIRFMNPLGEELCGWKEESARGRKLSSVLRIFDDISELPMDIPQVMETRLDSPAFFNSAYAINKHGGRIHIEGSVAPIVEPNKEILGQVISFRDVTDLRRMSETISYQASHDTLTGLYNREEFLQILGERIENMEKAEKPVFYFFIDIDNFRIVNDLCGHLAGDELLRQLSRDIRALFPSDATISRLAADSFGILFSSAYPEEALDRSQAILHTIRRTFLWQKNSFKITGSVGIVLISTDSKDVYTILAMGEDACRIAKEEGGNRCRRYEGKDKLFLKRRGEMQWITRLTTAVEENRFVLFKQDILPLDSTSGLPKKSEILLRLRETESGLIPPSDFIPAAERYNLMPTIDRWVIREAVRASLQLQEDTVFCINLSGSSIADESLFSYIEDLFSAYKAEPQKFCFEITETAAIETFSRAISFITKLKNLGSTLALDDFGNGFSSFSYLKRLPVDYLKIDGSYVQDMALDPINFSLVSAVNDIGHVMGMKTIAEFVKTEAIIVKLKELGVDYGQGYALAMPTPLKY